MRLVLVDWLDSYGAEPSWSRLKGADPHLMHCRSVGWLRHNGKDCKVIVPHISDPERSSAPAQGCGDMTIPSKAILRMYTLSDPRKRVRK
jgi:hypothetical protein